MHHITAFRVCVKEKKTITYGSLDQKENERTD